METAGAPQYELTERRIARLTLVVGVAASVGTSLLYSLRTGAGVLIGAVLAWVNFLFLERAMDAVTRASTAKVGASEARVPIAGYLGIFARYALIAVAVYVIFLRFQIPVLSMVVGLCALGAAAILATLTEVFSSSSDSR